MSVCNSSYEYGNWTVQILQTPDWNTQGWTNFVLPRMNMTFDGQTANLTLEGDFSAYPYMRSNDTDYEGGSLPEEDIMDEVLGVIRFNFQGVLDAYHSDVLDMKTTTPTWLRTVGFENNSMNIQASVGNGSPGRPHPGLTINVVMTLLFMLLIIYLAI